MHTWFYRDAAGRQLGPIGAEELSFLHQQGVIRNDTLIWREGMADWSPYAAVGPVQPSSAASGMPPRLPDAATAARAAPVVAAPKSRRSGCAIAALAVLGLLLLIGLPAIGILAAIAIPAYQDYTIRAEVTQARTATVPIQQAVDAWFDSHGQCPDDAWLARQPAVQTETVARMSVGRGPAGRCTLELQLTAVPAQIDGTVLLLESTSTGWRCAGGSIPSRYLPLSCKTDQGLATP